MLGFALLKEGDIQITPPGVAFAEADIQQRKVLFRQAVLEHVTILKPVSYTHLDVYKRQYSWWPDL